MSNPESTASAVESSRPPCVLVFNANDPSGGGGLSADTTAIASVGAHALPVLTGTYIRDSAEIFDFVAFDEDTVSEQARSLLEDIEVQIIKVGFAGSPENLGRIAETASDYPDTPVIAYMPNLSWWNEVQIDLYLDAFQELVLPQATVLVGSHSTLWRWLLPDWSAERSPSARDIARAAGEYGVAYTVVTGIASAEQFIDNVLTTPQTVVASCKFEHFDAVFAGAGDTLTAALAALLADGGDIGQAFSESLDYLDQCLLNGFRPGMGHVLPDRLFWAQEELPDDANPPDADNSPTSLDLPPHDTQH